MDETPSTTPIESAEPPAVRPPTFLWVVLIVAAFALGMGAGYLLWARPQEARAVAAEKTVVAQSQAAQADATAQSQAQSDTSQVEVPKEVKRYDVPVEDSPVSGSDSAPITIIEFSDYQCPFCLSWQNEVLPKIRAKYGEKVRLVYRNFPLYSIHPDAEAAAEAAMCAGAQKKYWEYHDLLFSGQKQLGADTYTSYAQSLGLDLTSFNKCVEDRRYQKDVKADYDFAAQLGVRSTPTFFINGLAVVGAQPFDVFQQIIDLELAGKIPK